MVTFTLALLGLAAQAIALPQAPTTSSAPPAEASSTLTVTVTGAPPADITAARTITRSVWTSTATVQANLNCTRTIYAPASTAPSAVAPPTPPPAGMVTPQAEPGEAALAPPEDAPVLDAALGLTARQVNPTNTTTVPLPPKTSPPTVYVTITVPSERTPRTRTIYTVSTATQAGAVTRTMYQCAATVAFQFAVDATTTIQYTLTAYPSTVTATATVSCPGGFGGGGFGGGGFGGGGFGGAGPGAGAPPPALPSSTLATVPVPSAATPHRRSQPEVPHVPHIRRQVSSTTATAAPTPPPIPMGNNGTLATSTIHLTRTAYTLVTVNATAALTATRYECSTISYDVTSTFVLTRTVWPSTITAASVIDCHQATTRTTRPATPGPELTPRQESPTTTATPAPTTASTVTTHHTRYIQSTTTVTETTPYLQIAYTCAPSPSPPPVATTPSTPPPAASP